MPHDPKHQLLHARPNVQTVWQIYAAFQTQDHETIFSLLSPDVEIFQSTELPWGGDFKGREGAQRFIEKLGGVITSTVMLQHFIDSGDTVIAIGRTQGVVKATGEAFDVPIAHMWTLRDGLAVQARYCIDHPAMLKALHPPDAEE